MITLRERACPMSTERPKSKHHYQCEAFHTLQHHHYKVLARAMSLLHWLVSNTLFVTYKLYTSCE